MARNFTNRAYQTRNTKSNKVWSWFIAGLILGLAIGGGSNFVYKHYSKKHSAPTNQFAQDDSLKQGEQSDSARPKFDFYTILSKNSNVGNQFDTSGPQDDSSTNSQQEPTVTKLVPTEKEKVVVLAPKSPAQSGDQYLLQIAAIKSEKDAARVVDRLKAQGFPAAHVNKDRRDWYRVMVGPYSSTKKAQLDKDRLSKLAPQYKPLIRKAS